MSIKAITEKNKMNNIAPNANSVEATLIEEATIMVDKNHPSNASNIFA